MLMVLFFFAYPPWYMPFGGHQQMCKNKFLSKLPWLHLLPSEVYKWVFKKFGEHENTVKELLEIKSTGISIDRLYRLLNNNNFHVTGEIFWFINPIYKWKFRIKSRKVLYLFTKIPYLRSFYTTAHYIIFRS